MSEAVQETAPLLHVSAQTVSAVQPILWSVTGAPPGTRLFIGARSYVGQSVWESRATFRADDSGLVDPATQAPAGGSYSGDDATGLLWSMLPRSGDFTEMPGRSLDPVDVEIFVERDGIEISQVRARRMMLADHIARRPITESGLVGTLFVADDHTPRPGVIVLGGSEGGLIESFAAALATEGFATLALAYFGVDGLPEQLSQVPVEYFGRALQWMQHQPEVVADQIAVAGASKGGEAALLVGSRCEDIAAVVGVVPSGAAFMSIGRTPLALRRSSWSIDGQGVPFVPARYSWPVVREFMSIRAPLRLRVFYDEAIMNTAAVAAATIPVERIRGPVLMLSGEDDQLWPSPVLAEIAEQRLQAHNHRWPHEHVTYPDCGHAINLPFMPAITEIPRAFLARSFVLGGTRPGTARAAVSAWEKVCTFLHESMS